MKGRRKRTVARGRWGWRELVCLRWQRPEHIVKSNPVNKENTVIEYLLCPWIKTWKLIEIKQLVPGCIARKRRSRDLNLGLTFQSCSLNHRALHHYMQ